MKHIRIRTLVLAVLLVFLLAACSGRDDPPDPGTPEPPPLNGSYVSQLGTISFNGDGETVTLDLSQQLAEAMGFPAGESEGTYVFLFHNGAWRYDAAESLRITVGDASFETLNKHGETDENAVVIQSPMDDSWLRFERTGNA